jgi:hypothetical protein
MFGKSPKTKGFINCSNSRGFQIPQKTHWKKYLKSNHNKVFNRIVGMSEISRMPLQTVYQQTWGFKNWLADLAS